MEEEKDHADWLIKRILFLEGHVDTVSREKVNIGVSVKEMLENDLDAERSESQDAVRARLRVVWGRAELLWKCRRFAPYNARLLACRMSGV